jgi:hypothetical protein
MKVLFTGTCFPSRPIHRWSGIALFAHRLINAYRLFLLLKSCEKMTFHRIERKEVRKKTSTTWFISQSLNENLNVCWKMWNTSFEIIFFLFENYLDAWCKIAKIADSVMHCNQKEQRLLMIERDIRNLYTNCSLPRSLGKNDRSTPKNLVCSVGLGYLV